MQQVLTLRFVLFIAFALISSTADACTIPVFRYALETWRPDPYEVLVFHKGELTDEQTQWIERFKTLPGEGKPVPNTAFVAVDLDGDVDPDIKTIWEAEEGKSLPWLMVRTPFKGGNQSVFAGPLTADNITVALGSPKRAELANRIVKGDSVVWVMLEGKDADRNDELAKTVAERISALLGEIKLPEIDPQDLATLSVDPDQLALKFSLLRLRPDDPAEKLLVESLLSVEPGLRDEAQAGEPMLFPIFGRGRCYFPLVGAGVNTDNINEMAHFLTGACQCTVKAQNPGSDLLLSIDWDAHINPLPQVEKPLPPLAGLAGFAEDEEVHNAGSDLTDTDQQSAGAKSPSTSTMDPPVSEAAEHSNPSSALPAIPVSTTTTTPIQTGIGSRVLMMAGIITVLVVIGSVVLLPKR